MSKTYWLETLGCPKNQVDSDKLETQLAMDGLSTAISPEEADVVIVNTCTFIEDSRKESLEVLQTLGEQKKKNAKLVATGCMAEKYGDELNGFGVAIDKVAGFGVPVTLSKREVPAFDLLNLPRAAHKNSWAYLKIAEGCDRKCGYCAIPSFRGAQRSRSMSEILDELESMNANDNLKEVVLVAQDLAAYQKDKTAGAAGRAKQKQPIIELIQEVSAQVEWVRLLYLYPSDLTDELIETILATPIPYFDLSLQHASRSLLKKMRRFGSAEIFLNQIEKIRKLNPDATFRSNFIVGYPGETEADQEELLDFISAAQLDWGAFFLYSEEAGTYSEGLGEKVPPELAKQRRAELQSLQLDITESRRSDLIGTQMRVLVDAEGEARSFREAPEIDGVIYTPENFLVGEFQEVKITGVSACDLHAEPI